MWIFYYLTFQPEGYNIGYGLGQPEKALIEYYTKAFSMKKPCQRKHF